VGKGFVNHFLFFAAHFSAAFFLLNGNWGFGTTDMFLDRSHMLQPEISDLCKAFTLKGKFLSDPKFAFTLEAYANDTPAPNILPKEANRVLQSIIDY
jgi:hypothetical protein